MRRLEIARYGPICKAVRFALGPLPAVGEHDVLLRVRAASVNPIDFKIAAGRLGPCSGSTCRYPMGFDCSGIIEQVGAQVRTFKVGDQGTMAAARVQRRTSKGTPWRSTGYIVFRQTNFPDVAAARGASSQDL